MNLQSASMSWRQKNTHTNVRTKAKRNCYLFLIWALKALIVIFILWVYSVPKIFNHFLNNQHLWMVFSYTWLWLFEENKCFSLRRDLWRDSPARFLFLSFFFTYMDIPRPEYKPLLLLKVFNSHDLITKTTFFLRFRRNSLGKMIFFGKYYINSRNFILFFT